MRDDRVYLQHVRDACQKILRYTSDGRDAFLSDERTQDAVIRNLEIIGEAVKSLSTDTKANYPEVHWKQIAGLRDKLIHEYFGGNRTSVGSCSIQIKPFLTVLEHELRRQQGNNETESGNR